MTNTEIEQQTEEVVHVPVADYKMVTFSLGGKDYGVNIMDVKEIAKFSNFTYVPNTAPYVRGVYNLRGEIISIIDLRIMFNLPAAQKSVNQGENGLVLRSENGLVGVIVDSIDRVVAISSESIQPPHPIFGDINIKYISGVVEHEERLYIILDSKRIFWKEDEVPDAPEPPGTAAVEAQDSAVPAPVETGDFLAEGLAVVASFHVTGVNKVWYAQRRKDWTEQHGEMQLAEPSEAADFLAPFYSPATDHLWPEAYAGAFADSLETDTSTIVNVLNPGCGAGYESYSIACALAMRYPEKQIKVWAIENDLLKVSSAPDIVVDAESAEHFAPFLTDGKRGRTFSPAIRDSILFEYGDIRNVSGLPPMDAVVMRDVVSFFPERTQERIFEMIDEIVKPGGLVVLGSNEQPVNNDDLTEVVDEDFVAYRKRKDRQEPS